MYTYDTVSEALTNLKKRGYAHDFNLKGSQMECKQLGQQWHGDDLTIEETYRFEGNSDPADEAVVYAIKAADGVKGTFVDAYGTYYDNDSLELLQHMRSRANSQ
jgi:hypothetical protein